MRDAVQHTDLAQTVVSGCKFCVRQAERAAAVPQAILRSTELPPFLISEAPTSEFFYPWRRRRELFGGGGGGGSVAEARASVAAARARVAAAREKVGGARVAAAAVGGGVVTAVVVAG